MTRRVSRCGIGRLGPKPYVSLYASFVHYLIDMIRGDTWLNLSCSDIENFSCKSADLAHTILLLLIQYSDRVAACELVLRVTIFRPCRMRD